MNLRRADLIWGGTEVRENSPEVERHTDVVYVPPSADPSGGWGIFARDGRLIRATGYFRGPVRHLPMQSEQTSLDCGGVLADAPHSDYIYGGLMHAHYGHFILSTLSRLWHIVDHGIGTTKILWNADDDPARIFETPHIGYLLRALGLSPDHFVVFHEPTRIGRLVVPHASFEELNFVHPAFARLTQHIGREALRSRPAMRSTRPAYISKTRLQSGVWHIVNEQALEDELERNGVDIVHPEQLSHTEQIALFAEREVVAGPLGSAFHTSAFVEGGARLVAFSRFNEIVSNYLLADAACGTQAEYLFPDAGFMQVPSDGGFALNTVIEHPKQFATELLRAIERTTAGTLPRSEQGKGRRMAGTERLDAIGLRHGTDKASNHHDFLRFYERFLGDYKAAPALTLLEIGVYDGASIRMWAEYFPQATIVGIDINPDAARHAGGNVTVEIADQSNVASLVALAVKHGPFDIVLDDGSHQWNHQLTTLQYLYPFVKPGGYYVLEDLDTSYGSHAPTFKGIASASTASYLRKMCDYLVGDAVLDIAAEEDAFIRSYAPLTEAMSYYRRTCVIQRRDV